VEFQFILFSSYGVTSLHVKNLTTGTKTPTNGGLHWLEYIANSQAKNERCNQHNYLDKFVKLDDDIVPDSY
jgi:hypothetical protein